MMHDYSFVSYLFFRFKFFWILFPILALIYFFPVITCLTNPGPTTLSTFVFLNMLLFTLETIILHYLFFKPIDFAQLNLNSRFWEVYVNENAPFMIRNWKAQICLSGSLQASWHEWEWKFILDIGKRSWQNNLCTGFAFFF